MGWGCAVFSLQVSGGARDQLWPVEEVTQALHNCVSVLHLGPL